MWPQSQNFNFFTVPYPDIFSYHWIDMGAENEPKFLKTSQFFLNLISLITVHSSYIIIL